MDENWSDLIISTKKTVENSDLVDLTDENRVRLLRDTKIYNVTRKDEMRIDLICNSIYGSFKYIHELLKINEIKNPFSIKNGDPIFHTIVSQAEDLLGYGTEFSDERESLVEAFKKSQVDPTRYEFLKEMKVQKDFVPSVVIPKDFNDVVVQNGIIRVTPSLSENTTYNVDKDIRDRQINAIKKQNGVQVPDRIITNRVKPKNLNDKKNI
jgi:hypothetical protein